MSQAHILIVEDEALSSLHTATRLRKRGYSVSEVRSGEEALRLVAEDEEIDMILMDISLGEGMDGFQAAKAILGERELPIVFLSVHAEDETVAKADAIGSYGFVSKEAGTGLLDASIRMALRLFETRTNLARANEELRRSVDQLSAYNEERARSEERFHRLFELNPAAMVISRERDGLILDVNRSFCSIFNLAREAMVGKSSLDPTVSIWLRPEDRADYVREIEEKGAARNFEAEFLRRGHGGFSGQISGGKIDIDGRECLLSVLIDVTEKREAERKARESDRLYRETFMQSGAVKFLFDTDSLEIVEANEAAAAFYGYPRERLLEMRIPDINAANEETIKANIRLAIDERKNHFYYRHRLASGEEREVEVFASAISAGGRNLIHSIVFDVTEKNKAEGELQRLVEEKETLMKELQHRVKNNLNVVASLLGLEQEKCRDAEARKAFANAISRVGAIAAVYEKLYSSQDLSGIDIGPYAEELAQGLFATYNLDPARIELAVDFDELHLDAKRCVPFGLVLNELLSNALKYAYPEGRRGQVRVSLRAAGGRAELSVEDDGPGVPAEYRGEDSQSMGMTLARMLAQQLGGGFELDCSRGTRALVRFPL